MTYQNYIYHVYKNMSVVDLLLVCSLFSIHFIRLCSIKQTTTFATTTYCQSDTFSPKLDGNFTKIQTSVIFEKDT